MPTMNGASLRVGFPSCFSCHSKPRLTMLVSVCSALSGDILVRWIMVFTGSNLRVN